MAQAPMAMTYLGSGIWLYRRTTCGAIFLVTVPATIIRSACRGEGRKTSAPKRARSYRAMVVAIISMAQQARPNCSGQTEFFRPQLYISPNVVVKIPCLLNSLRSPSSMVSTGSVGVLERWSIVFPPLRHSDTPLLHFPLLPRQYSLLPGPDQTFDQQQEKNYHRHKRPRR